MTVSDQPVRNEHRWPPNRIAALGGLVGPIIFVIVIAIAAARESGYSHLGQKISELGGQGASYPLLQNLNFLLLGVLVIGFAWALSRSGDRLTLGATLVGLFGLLSCIANGLLPCDRGCLGATPIGLLHNITGLTGFVAAIAGALVLARRWRHDRRWRSHIRFTRIIAALATAGLIWFVATQALDAQSLAGLAQRTFIAALLLWIAATATRLVVPPRPIGGATTPARTETR
jgi:hypothetical membrane protein